MLVKATEVPNVLLAGVEYLLLRTAEFIGRYSHK